MQPIEYFNRHRRQIESEAVYGESFLRFLYNQPMGAIPLHAMVKRAAFSRWYGRRMSRPASRTKILPFIRDYQLDPDEFANAPESFSDFNAFFSRQLKPEARPIDPTAAAIFPADGRHLGFACAAEIDSVFVKGQSFDLPQLLGDRELAERFANGPLVLSRLCPVDYHRFHFPCDGTPGATRTIDGPLFSVSPIALRRRLAYLWQNKRGITQLDSPTLGTILILEIGATCVGSIQQTFEPNQPVKCGDEKGYFAFGGSSTITLFEPNRVVLAADLLEHSAARRELYAQMGSPMAQSLLL